QGACDCDFSPLGASNTIGAVPKKESQGGSSQGLEVVCLIRCIVHLHTESGNRSETEDYGKQCDYGSNRFELRPGCVEVGQTRADRFLGRLVRSLPRARADC